MLETPRQETYLEQEGETRGTDGTTAYTGEDGRLYRGGRFTHHPKTDARRVRQRGQTRLHDGENVHMSAQFDAAFSYSAAGRTSSPLLGRITAGRMESSPARQNYTHDCCNAALAVRRISGRRDAAVRAKNKADCKYGMKKPVSRF